MKSRILLFVSILVLGGAAVSTSGCAGTKLSKSTGEYLDDAAITAKVKSAFATDPVVSAFGVGVDTFKGTVQLNGFVDSPEEKSRAEQIARAVPGVVAVQNKVTIKGRAPR